MGDQKRFKSQGFAALSGMLSHPNFLEGAAAVGSSTEAHGASELQSLLLDIQEKLARVVSLLGGGARESSRGVPALVMGQSIDGVYDGQGNMVADDGVRYKVPGAYALKAGLREGDMLSFVVLPNGMKKYKKIRN